MNSRGKKILLIGDCDLDRLRELLADELKERIDLKYIDCSISANIRWGLGKSFFAKIINWICYFYLALYAFFLNKKFKYIISWQQGISILYGIMCRITRKDKKFTKLIGLNLTFVSAERKESKFWKWLYTFGIRSECIWKLTSPSFKLADEFNKFFNVTKIQGLHFYFDGETNANNYEKNEYDIFSGGAHSRDWKTLLKALEGSNLKVCIIAPATKGIEYSDYPNIKFITNATGKAFSSYIKKSRIVVIPMLAHGGDSVLLRAFCFRKPVIGTAGFGLEEYIETGKVGFLVKYNSVNSLKESLNKVFNHPDSVGFIHNLGQNAYNKFINTYSLEKYIKRLRSCIMGVR